MIKELCQYIENGTGFTIGTDLFAISVDSDLIDTCVIIAEPSPGLANGILTDYRQIPLVAYSRATTRFTARDNMYTVFDLLHGKAQINLPVVDGGETFRCNLECGTPVSYWSG